MNEISDVVCNLKKYLISGLTEVVDGRTHQINNDLTVMNATYSCHASLWSTTVHSNMECQTGSQIAGWKW